MVGRLDVAAWNFTLLNTLDADPGLAIKASQGVLHGWAVINTAAAVTYVQIFDAAAVTDVTLGTTVPKGSIPLAASGVSVIMEADLQFATGIVLFATTTLTGNTGAAVQGMVLWA